MSLNKRLLLLAAALLLCASSLWALDFPNRAEVVKIEDLSHDVKRIRLQLQEGESFSFEPGQFTFIQVPEEHIKQWNQKYGTDHEEVFRAYSFASAPSSLPVFDFIIKHAKAPRDKDVPPGIASTWIHKRLKVGDKVSFTAPIGSLYQEGDQEGPLLMVAGGVGIAPFVGLIEYWFEEGINNQSPIYLFFGVRAGRDLVLHQLFTKWMKTKQNFHYVPALSHPESCDNWKGDTGYINIVLDKRIDDMLPDFAEAHAYLAGPPIMITETEKVLKRRGLGEDRIRYDEITVP
jgi:Na+-transporting NADH:ubiquinone oxidoreductase subunit F